MIKQLGSRQGLISVQAACKVFISRRQKAKRQIESPPPPLKKQTNCSGTKLPLQLICCGISRLFKKVIFLWRLPLLP